MTFRADGDPARPPGDPAGHRRHEHDRGRARRRRAPRRLARRRRSTPCTPSRTSTQPVDVRPARRGAQRVARAGPARRASTRWSGATIATDLQARDLHVLRRARRHVLRDVHRHRAAAAGDRSRAHRRRASGPETPLPPIAVRDLAFLPAGGEVTVDPLANDTDPAGGVLVLQSVDVPDGLRRCRSRSSSTASCRSASQRTLDAPGGDALHRLQRRSDGPAARSSSSRSRRPPSSSRPSCRTSRSTSAPAAS